MMFPFTTPSPSPADIPTEPWEASPGVEGFLLGFFLLGIALAFLMWSMNRHLRKIKHSATVEKRRVEAEAKKSEQATKGSDQKSQGAKLSKSEQEPPKGEDSA
ncbi:hypothetical protein [Flaviflexus huanghaiensis]|uniref:hypothetical protein n=1 Tax=Flaviflexus huanghaiensis TaxID=1111473 RepID=UPI0015FDFFE1|nr:hypothetical protein [Flaviflexus huanghaiensis]